MLKGWFDAIVETYPPETSMVLRKNSDRFANPVGHTFSTQLEVLLDGLIENVGPEVLHDPIDQIVRIRAVQDFPAARAVEFVFGLKDIVRGELGGDEAVHAVELREFERRVDELALKCFEIYAGCLRTLYEIRAQEAKSRVHMLIRRANEAL